jgi:hypothetical protein
MAASSPKWLRERLEGGTRFSDRGAWFFAAALAGVIALFAAVLVWLWYNLAYFR